MRVIVVTCDKYSHIIPIFWHFYRKHWPDNHWHTTIVTNEKKIPCPSGADVLYLGPDKQYATNMKLALQKIRDPYFLLMQEDYILRWVDLETMREGFKLIQRPEVHCVRLYPMPGPDAAIPYSRNFGELDKAGPYSLSLQTSFWKRALFQRLLVDGETPWETELQGSSRVAKLPRSRLFLASYKPALEYGQYCTGGAENDHEKKWVEENW